MAKQFLPLLLCVRSMRAFDGTDVYVYRCSIVHHAKHIIFSWASILHVMNTIYDWILSNAEYVWRVVSVRVPIYIRWSRKPLLRPRSIARDKLKLVPKVQQRWQIAQRISTYRSTTQKRQIVLATRPDVSVRELSALIHTSKSKLKVRGRRCRSDFRQSCEVVSSCTPSFDVCGRTEARWCLNFSPQQSSHACMDRLHYHDGWEVSCLGQFGAS